MNLQIFSFPNHRAVSSQYSKFKGSDTGEAIYQALEKSHHTVDDDTTLIIDKSSCFKRISQDDPICRYYRGRIGDIFRIRNPNSVGYRMVVKPAVTSVVKKTLSMEATAELYYKSFTTTIAMLIARQTLEDSKITDGRRISQQDMIDIISNEQYDFLNLDDIPNKYGQMMYVRFVNKNTKDLTFAKLKTDYLNTMIEDIIKQYNATHGCTVKNDANLFKTIDIIFIINNAKGLPIGDMKLQSDFVQIFSVQQLSFDITKYSEQPEFTLLNINNNRSEIREQYLQNGQVISKTATLDSFNLKENNKILVI